MRKSWIIISAICLPGCSFEPSESTVRISVSPARVSPSNSDRSNGQTVGFTPTSASAFGCLLVNVVGPGIGESLSGSQGASVFEALASGASYCSYPGIMSAPISNSSPADVTLTVPNGIRRVVQVLGVVDSNGTVCGSGSAVFETNSVELYELGRAQLDLSGNSVVNIMNSYDNLNYSGKVARKSNCNTSAAAFSPTSYGTVLAWYQGNAVTAAGGTIISTWPSSLSGGYSIGNSQNNTYPSTSALNGNKVIHFPGTGVYDYFTNTAGSFGGSYSDFTILSVIRSADLSTVAARKFLKLQFRPTFDYLLMRLESNFEPTFEIYKQGTGTCTVTASSDSLTSTSRFYLLGAVRDTTAGKISIRKDRVAYSSSCTVNNSLDFSTSSNFYVGGENATCLKGDVAEVILWANALTSSQLEMAECHLSYKYGLGLSGC